MFSDILTSMNYRVQVQNWKQYLIYFSTGVFGQKSTVGVPPPPPPPPPMPKSGLGTNDDIPMPPEYSYPRFLEPEIDKKRRETEHNNWTRKADTDYDTTKAALTKESVHFEG